MKSRTDGGCEHRRAQIDVGERVLGVLARRAAAREERLERLRGELDDPVAVDAPGPAALERELLRREHAEPHGSVCTITSAISGRSRRIRSSISLARACASASGSCRVEPEREERDEPVVGAAGSGARAASDPVTSRTIRRTAASSSDVLARAPARLGQRLEVRLHRRRPRARRRGSRARPARRRRAPPRATGRRAA